MENNVKTVLITGAGGNVGLASVRAFLMEGYRVIALVSPGKTLDVESDNLHVIEADLRNEDAAEKIVGDCFSKFGSLHAALITAGGYAGGQLSSVRWHDIETMISLNFQTAFNIARPVFLRMKEQPGGGRIVLFGARAALVPGEGQRSLAYSLSKQMLFHLAALLNAEGQSHDVVTSVVVPGTIDTPQNREAMPKSNFSDWVSPEEFAKLMAFLCSADAKAMREPVIRLYGRS